MEQTERSDKIQMPGNDPKQRIQHSEHSKSLKSRNLAFLTYKDEQHVLAIIHFSHVKSHNYDLKTHKIPLRY